MKRLPQFDVGPGLLLRALPAGLVVSVAAWLLVGLIPFLSYFLAILVGAGVGEVISRLSRRRSSRILDAGAVGDVVLGLVLVASIRPSGDLSVALSRLAAEPRAIIGLLVPAIVASFVAVVKLR